jgi:putative transferase (TIGR04331 family)
LYLADQVEKKTKYFCGQHGNNYFTAYQLSLSIELRTCDKFLSWGYKDNKKVVPFFNFNLVNKIGSRRFFDKLGNLLIICSKVGSNISPIDRSRVDINAIEDTLEIVKKLKNHISKNLIIRLEDNYIKFFSGYYYNRYFSKTKFNIDLKKKNLRDLQKKSRLNLFNYYSTGMLENFLLNIPSICYLQKDFEYQNDFFQKKVKYLVDANIVFYDKKKLLNHITKIWNNVDDWWFSEKTKKQIDKFNNDFNFGSNNYDKLRIFFNNVKI